jgi:hypothetical protein
VAGQASIERHQGCGLLRQQLPEVGAEAMSLVELRAQGRAIIACIHCCSKNQHFHFLRSSSVVHGKNRFHHH